MAGPSERYQEELLLLPARFGIGVYLCKQLNYGIPTESVCVADSDDSCGSGIQQWAEKAREDAASEATSYASAVEASFSSGSSFASLESSDDEFLAVQSEVEDPLTHSALFLDSLKSTDSLRHSLEQRKTSQSMVLKQSMNFHAKVAGLQKKAVHAMAQIQQDYITREVEASLIYGKLSDLKTEERVTESLVSRHAEAIPVQKLERVGEEQPSVEQASVLPIHVPSVLEPTKETLKSDTQPEAAGDLAEGSSEQHSLTEAVSTPLPRRILDPELFAVYEGPTAEKAPEKQEEPTEAATPLASGVGPIPIAVTPTPQEWLQPTELPVQPTPFSQEAVSPVAGLAVTPVIVDHPSAPVQSDQNTAQCVSPQEQPTLQPVTVFPVLDPGSSSYVLQASESIHDTEMPDQVSAQVVPLTELLRMSEQLNIPHELPPPATLFSVAGMPSEARDDQQVALHAAKTAMEFEAYHREIAQQMIVVMGSYQTDVANRSICKAIDRNMKLDVAQISAQESQIHAKVNGILGTISGVANSPGVIYAYVQLARRLISKCAGISTTLVFAVAKTTVRVMERHPQLLSILLCFLHEVSVLTVPKYYSSERVHETLLDRLGFKDIPGVGVARKESEDEFISRQSGYVQFYAAIVELNSPVHGLEYGWSYMSRMLNNLPPSRITASALMSFLNIAGYALFAKYRKQFFKVLLYIHGRFLVQLASSHDQEAQAVYSRLETYLQTHQFTKPNEFKRMPQSALSHRVHS